MSTPSQNDIPVSSGLPIRSSQDGGRAFTDITITAIQNPFDPYRSRLIKQVPFEEGKSARDYIADLVPAAREGLDVKAALNGRLFEDDEQWSLSFPAPGDSLVFTVVPHDGDSGKQVMTLVAVIAVAVIAYYGGPAAAGAMQSAGWIAQGSVAAAGYFSSMAIMVVGGVLINHLIPPPEVDLGALGSGAGGLDTSATYSWATAQNRINQGGAIGVLYGTVRVTPQVIAKHTSLVDEDDTEKGEQYLNVLYAVADHYTDFIGYLMINDQNEESYPDVKSEVRRGWDVQNAIKLFGTTYSEVPISLELNSAFNEDRDILNYRYLDFGDDYNAFETKLCSSILIELYYPRGFGNYEQVPYYSGGGGDSIAYNFDGQGGMVTSAAGGDGWTTRWELQGEATGIYDVRYRVKGTTTWQYTTFSVTGYRNRRFRGSGIVEFPTTDIYEVGIKQQNAVIEGATGTPYRAELSAITSYHLDQRQVVHTTSTGIDRLVVSIVLPQGLYHLGDDGELEDISVQVNVDVRRIGSNTWNSQLKRITAATNATLRRYFYYTFDSPGQFEVRVYFAAPPPRELRYSSRVFLDHVKEGLWEGFRYPGTSLLAMRALATEQLSGGMPRVSMLAQREMVRVHDGNGWLFMKANNPAWACYDMLVSPRYGGNVETSRILYAEFSEWADFCTANGFEVNAYFDTTVGFATAVNRMSAVGRGTIMQKGTDFGVVIDRPGTATQLFTIANIVADSFKVTYLGIEDRLNAVEVTYTDAAKDYRREVLEVRTHEFSTDDEVRKASLDLSFITDRALAVKHAEYLLKNNLYLRKKISFQADVDAIACMVGDVIKVQHDVPYWSHGGRVVSATADTVTLDVAVTREVGETYAILVRHQDDTLEEVNIESVVTETTGAILPLVGAWSQVPEADAVYSFGERYEVTEEFRLLAVTRSGDLRCTLECIEYNAAVYENTFSVPEYDTDPITFLVKNLRADEFWRDQDGAGVGVMELTWDGDGILFYVWYRRENTGHWVRAGETSTNHFEVQYLDPGITYDFCVSGTRSPEDGEVVNKRFDGWGNKVRTVWPVTNLEILGQGLNTVWQDRDLKLRWALQTSNTQAAAGMEPTGAGSFPPTTDFSKYRVQICNPDGSLRREFFTVQNEYVYTYELNHEDTVSNALIVKVWAVDRYGYESFSPAVISVSNPAPAAPSGLKAVPFFRAVAFTWLLNGELDFHHYTYATRINDGAWSAWEEIDKTTHTRYLSEAEIAAQGGAQTLVHIKVRAHDSFGNISGESTTFAEITALMVAVTDIEDFSITGSKMFTKIPILENDLWYANTPAAGRVNWNAHKVYYNGVAHDVAAGDTAVSSSDSPIFIYWQQATPTVYQTSTTHPGDDGTLGEHDFIIAVNVNGSYSLAWNSVANQVIGSAYIMKAAINDLHVNEVSASKIKAASIMTPGVFMGDALYGEETSGRVVTASVADAGLYLTSSYLGFYNGASWASSTYIKSDGKFRFSGDANNYIEWDGSDLVVRGDIIVENWAHPSDTTKIDGGQIYTNTITATQIAAGTITAANLKGVDFGTLTISSSGKVVIQTTNGLEISGGGNVYVKEGCDIRLQRSATDTADIRFIDAAGNLEGSIFNQNGSLNLRKGPYGGRLLFGDVINYWEEIVGYAGDRIKLLVYDDAATTGTPAISQIHLQQDLSSLTTSRGTLDKDATVQTRVYPLTDDIDIDFIVMSEGVGKRCRVRHNYNSVLAFYPEEDDEWDLGISGHRWDDIWATNVAIQTSDVREKADIERASLGLDFVERLDPISFRWKDRTRKHYGFAAQQIEEVLSDLGISTNDFAGLIHDKQTDKYGTRPGELLPVLWRAVQQLSHQLNLVKEKING